MEHLIFILIVLSLLLIAFLGLRRLYIIGRKNAKGAYYVNRNLCKFKKIISFQDWYKENEEEIEDNWLVFGRGFCKDTFAVELFKGNEKIIKRMKRI